MPYSLIYLAIFLILEPFFERACQYLFCYQPLYFKLTAGKSHYAYTVKERNYRFHNLRQIILMSAGVILMAFLAGIEICNKEDIILKGFFLLSLGCILEPLCEMIYYRRKVNRYWKKNMTAKEMSAYHDLCERYNRHSFSLNGKGRQKLRFLILIAGIFGLLSISLIIF